MQLTSSQTKTLPLTSGVVLITLDTVNEQRSYLVLLHEFAKTSVLLLDLLHAHVQCTFSIWRNPLLQYSSPPSLPALLEDSSLLSECLAVMRGYQLLSPSLFAQADFNPTKLLPSLLELQAGGHTAHPTVLASTLRLLEEAPGDYFNWRQQV